MHQKVYGKSLNLEAQVTDVIPEYRLVYADVDMHCHNFYEIEVVARGSGTQILNGQLCQLRQGSVTLMSPSDFHSVSPQNDLHVYNFMFRGAMISPEILEQVWAYDGNKFLNFQENDFRDIIFLCQLLEREHQKETEDRPVFMKNLMECFFMLLLRALKRQDTELPRKMSTPIQTCIQYLHQHFRENPPLPQTASIVSLSPNYFAHRFHEEMGLTYTEYLTKLKLEQAKKLLLSSSLSVTEVCFSSGFTSISNFMKVFKKDTGCSPRQYMQSRQGMHT